MPFPNGRIPSNRFDGVAVKLLDRYIPLPNQPDGRWVQPVTRPTDGDQYLIRGDHNFSANNSLNVRYFRDKSGLISQTGNIVPYSPARQSLSVTNWALADTHTFSPALLNEFRIGVMRADSLVTILEQHPTVGPGGELSRCDYSAASQHQRDRLLQSRKHGQLQRAPQYLLDGQHRSLVPR